MDAVEFADETGFAEESDEQREPSGASGISSESKDKGAAGDGGSAPPADGAGKAKGKVLEATIVSQRLVKTKAAGPMMVTVAGDPNGKSTILLLPDVGIPARMAFGSFLRSLRGHPLLLDARFLMVDLPGQFSGAPAWDESKSGPFPTVEKMSEGVMEAAAAFGVKQVLLCVGLGLGANLSLRMIAKKKYFIHGQVLVGPTADAAPTQEWLSWQPRLLQMASGDAGCSASTRSALVGAQMSASSSADHVRKEAELALADVPERNAKMLVEAWLARDPVDMDKVRKNAESCVASLVATCADSTGEVLRLSVGALQRIVGIQGEMRRTVFMHLHSACNRTEAMHLQGGSLSISERPVSFARALDFFLQGCMGIGLR